MLSKLIVLAALALSTTARASDIKCPEAGGADSLTKTVSMIKAAESCYDADQIASQCAWGSSADVQIAAAAGDVCAKAYRGKLTPSDKAIFSTLTGKCQKKYAKAQGTMYIGAEAFCEESVAKLFSDLYSPVE